MIRLTIHLPRNSYHAIIRSRESVANVLYYAMSRYGDRPELNQPSKWGFGVISEPVPGNRALRRIRKVVVGTSDPVLSEVMAKITSADLFEPHTVPGAGLDLRGATITYEYENSWQETECFSGYCISPIRVIAPNINPHKAVLVQTGELFNQMLNQNMETRFEREFHLAFIPDEEYVRSRGGNIEARMAIKVNQQGKVIIGSGIVTPFLLAGPNDELKTCYFSGLGAGTARGFGSIAKSYENNSTGKTVTEEDPFLDS